MVAPFSHRARRGFELAGIAVSILSASSPTHGQKIHYMGSLQIATGNYIFTERTSGLYFFNRITVSNESFRFSTSIPVIFQNTPWVSYGGAGMYPTGGPQHSEVAVGMGRDMMDLSDMSDMHNVGLGDPIVHTDLVVLKESRSAPSVRFANEIKLPLADLDHGFGTGEWDYGSGVSLSKNVGSRFVFLDLMYWRLGDMPDLEFLDPVAYNVAVGQPLGGGRYAILASLSGYSTVVDGMDPPVQLGIALTRMLESRRSIHLSAEFGLTGSAPDLLLSVGWQIGS